MVRFFEAFWTGVAFAIVLTFLGGALGLIFIGEVGCCSATSSGFGFAVGLIGGSVFLGLPALATGIVVGIFRACNGVEIDEK